MKQQENGRRRPAVLRLRAEYLAEHAHLAYATTAYGVQGTTVVESHTVLSDALDAAGVYVGMTRGRTRNLLHIVAIDLDDARAQFTAALQRDRADRGLTEAARAARAAVSDLVPDGLAVVITEQARLRRWIATADRESARWERAADALARQSADHHTEHARQAQIVATAEAHAARVREEVAAPLIAEATADASNCLATQKRMWLANRALQRSGRLGWRAADRTAREANRTHESAAEAMRRRWGAVPQTAVNLLPWAEAAALRRADDDPRVIEVQEGAARARRQLQTLTAHHTDAQAALWRSIGDGRPPSAIETRAARWRNAADAARRMLVEIDTLPIGEAARLIRQKARPAALKQIAEDARQVETRRRDPRRGPQPSL